MKNGLKDIIGKRIASVVVAAGKGAPRQQVFLVFADGTRFEFYGENFTCCGGLDAAQGVEGYVEDAGGKIERVYGDLAALAPAKKTAMLMLHDDTPAPSTLEKQLHKDLDAWRLAKDAIAKAKA